MSGYGMVSVPLSNGFASGARVAVCEWGEQSERIPFHSVALF